MIQWNVPTTERKISKMCADTQILSARDDCLANRAKDLDECSDGMIRSRTESVVQSIGEPLDSEIRQQSTKEFHHGVDKAEGTGF